MPTMTDTIRMRVQQALQPVRLEIEDDSARHHGHAGARSGGGSHFNVIIVSAAFSGRSRVERQRLVYAALGEEMKGPIHALSLKALTPEEDP